MSIEPKELRPEQMREIEARSEWPMRSRNVASLKQAEEDVRALLGHAAALHKINCLANDRIVALNERLDTSKVSDHARRIDEKGLRDPADGIHKRGRPATK